MANAGEGWSPSGENGGVRVYPGRVGATGLGSPLGVEKEDRFEKRPIEEVLDREVSCGPSDSTLRPLRGVYLADAGGRESRGSPFGSARTRFEGFTS